MRATLLLAVLLLATRPVDGQSPPQPTAGERYKSVRVLKDIPAAQIIEVMSVMAGSLGVTCAHCHGSEWESDEKPMKDKARQMIALTRQVDASFGGNGTITCNTCHNGQAVPRSVASVEQAGWNKVQASLGDAPVPSVSSVYDTYEKALGGAEQLRRFSGRSVDGKVTRDNGRTGPASGTFTLQQRMPATAAMKTEFSFPPEASSEITSDFLRARRLQELIARSRVIGRSRLHDRSTLVVEVANPTGTYRLHFDDESGLLVARESDKPTPLGRLAERYELSDYRAVDGVLEPHRIEWLRADYHVTFEVTAVTHQTQ